MKKRIEIPEYFKGMSSIKSGLQRNIKVFGGDTETALEKPLSFQICGDNLKCELLFFDEFNSWNVFIDYLRSVELGKNCNHGVIFFHNLGFDLSVLTYSEFKNIHIENNEFTLKGRDFKAEFIYDKLVCGRIVFYNEEGLPKKRFNIVDSFAFFPMSLDAISKEFGLEGKKPKPEGLGTTIFTEKDKNFMEYALNDAVLEMLIGVEIVKLHKFYDVELSVSCPQLTQRVFSKNYLKYAPFVFLPHKRVLEACVSSYHGGKSGFYVDRPSFIKKVYDVDVISMYPYCMARLPCWTEGTFKPVDEIGEYEGVYQISGEAVKCKYPVLFNHDFKPLKGFFKNVWVTSYELKEALSKEEVFIDDLRGFVWIPDENAINPLTDFCNEFFILKENARTGEGFKRLYKNMLVSLSGKFFQNINYDNMPGSNVTVDDDLKIIKVEKEEEYGIAGGLFNPFIATLITGRARTYLHKLEHRFNAIMSSTDSVKTLIKPDNSELNGKMGGLEIKNYGDLLCLRSRLHVHYGYSGKITYSMHGFNGKIEDIENLFKSKGDTYPVERIIKLREALSRGLKPLTVEKKDMRLNLKWR